MGVGRARNGRGEEKSEIKEKEKNEVGYEIGKRRRSARKTMILYCVICQLLSTLR